MKKILYSAADRHDAQLAAFALRGLGPDFAIAWTSSLSGARTWIDENRNIAALIVEIESDPEACQALVTYFRHLGETAAVVVLAAGRSVQSITPANTGADEVIAKSGSLSEELPAALQRAFNAQAARDRRRVAGATGPKRVLRGLAGRLTGHPFTQAPPGGDDLGLRLTETLMELDQARQGRAADAERTHALEARLEAAETILRTRPAPTFPISPSPFEDLRPQITADDRTPDPYREMREALERQLADAGASLERTARQHADEMSAAAARLAHAEERSARAAIALDVLRAQLVDQATAVQQSDQQAAADRQSAAEMAARKLATLEADLVRESANRRVLEKALFSAEVARVDAEQAHASDVDALKARLGEHERLGAQRAAEAAKLNAALEAAHARTAVAVKRVEDEAATVHRAALADAAERHSALGTVLSEESSKRRALEHDVQEAETLERRAAERHAAEMAQAAAKLAEFQSQSDALLAQAAAATDALQQKLIEQAHALQRIEQDAAAARHAAAAQAAARQSQLEADLAQALAGRQALTQQLATVEVARDQAAAEHATARAAADAELAAHQQRAEARHAEMAAAADAERARAEEQLRSAVAAAAARLTEHQAEANARLTETVAAAEADRARAADEFRAAVSTSAARLANLQADTAQRLAEAAAIVEAERTRAASDLRASLAAAATHLAEHHQEAEARYARDAAALDSLRSDLAAAARERRRADERAALELQTAVEAAAERQATFDAAIKEHSGREVALTRELAEARAAAERAADAHTGALADAASHLAKEQQTAARRLSDALAAGEAERARILVEAAAARDAALVDAATEHEVAARQLADALAAAAAERTQLLAEAAAARDTALLDAASERQAAARALGQRQALFDTALQHEISQREMTERALADARAAADDAQRRFLEGVNAMRDRARDHEQQLEARAAKERAEWEATLAAQQERIGQLQSEGELARQSLAARDEHLQRSVEAQRDERLQAQRAAEAAATAIADLEARLRLSHEARDESREAIEQLQSHIDGLGLELATTRGQRDVFQTDAKLVPQLRREMEDLREARRRDFEHSPARLYRCRRDGTVTQATRALAELLGYASAPELEAVDAAARVFDTADELRWLIDCALASRVTESIATSWKRKDGRRVPVRLEASASDADVVEIAVQDLTATRELEEKLRTSQRHEAVARNAAEVAVTCEHLLRDVTRDGQQWLTRIESGILRHQAETLLGDVGRAAGFLRQLAAYGEKQKTAAEPVDAGQVLRNLESVLKSVAGANIDVSLPAQPSPLPVEVATERLERILVNVAAYARERMPAGGRLTIETAPAVVDRTFAEKYPSVRPGAHVLFTVTGSKTAEAADWPETYRNRRGASSDAGTEPPPPGVDLGVLQTLVSECSGHLWFSAEPTGDMLLKIHLPQRDLADEQPAKPAGSWLNRLMTRQLA